MPNHEWLKPLKEHAAKLQNELTTINGVLALYDAAAVPPPAVSVPKIKKEKKTKVTKHIEEKRNRIAPADKNTLRVLIAKGRSNDEILKELAGKVTIAHIYTARYELKKEEAAAA